MKNIIPINDLLKKSDSDMFFLKLPDGKLIEVYRTESYFCFSEKQTIDADSEQSMVVNIRKEQ